MFPPEEKGKKGRLRPEEGEETDEIDEGVAKRGGTANQATEEKRSKSS